MIEINKNGKILGRVIHEVIESKTKDYSVWIKRRIFDADLKLGKDYSTILLESTGGRPAKEYEFSIDAAKEICLLERNEKGKQLRRWLIELSKSHETGLAFTAEQVEALIDLSKSMCLISIQKEVERKHFDFYNNKFSWYKYRAELIGYST